MNAEVKTEMDMIFGTLLRKYRHDHGYTQGDMSEKLGISEKYVSRVETGTGGISKETLTKFMNILEISPNVLFKDFITNPQLKMEIEVSEQIRGLSEDKLQIVLKLAKMLKELR